MYLWYNQCSVTGKSPQLQLEEHGIVTALVELTKDVDPEEGLCHLILETLAAVMSADNVDFSWLYTLG